MAKETKEAVTEEMSAEMKALFEKIASLEAKNKELSTPVNPVSERDLAIAYLEERVQVQLFKDDAKYKDDLPVCVNGETILIQRGYPVMIKRKHALVIESQNRQELVAIRVSEGLAGYRKME